MILPCYAFSICALIKKDQLPIMVKRGTREPVCHASDLTADICINVVGFLDCWKHMANVSLVDEVRRDMC